jgi:hypothetical protein
MDVIDEELREFQQKLERILKEFLEQGRIEIYGNLKIVVTSFDRINRMAFLKGNTILIREYNLRERQGTNLSGIRFKVYN